MARIKKSDVKKIGDGVFETKDTVETFGRSVAIEGGGAVQELETHATRPLVDDASGRRFVLRAFEFQMPPDAKGWVNKQKLLDTHKRFIQDFCWKDGLVVNTDVPPRIVISKNEKKFRIFALTEAKMGATILETPLTLQDITNNASPKYPK